MFWATKLFAPELKYLLGADGVEEAEEPPKEDWVEKALMEFWLPKVFAPNCWVKALDVVGTGSPNLNPELTEGRERSKVGGDGIADNPSPLELE